MSKSGKKIAKKASVKRPYAELFKDEGGGFRYRIKGANGEPMVTSESYTKVSDAADGLFALVKVFVKFDKWYAKDDDSWLRDTTELGDHNVDEPSAVGGLRDPDGFGN